jgi:uncharacterized membrane protein (UPF0136 family)
MAFLTTSYITLLLYAYAFVLVAGGVFGYLKAQSMPSLIAGIGSAALIVIAALLLPHHPRIGLGLSIVTSIALAVFFLRRFTETKKPMPAIPVIAVSAIVLIACVLRLVTAMQAHHA